MVVGDMGEIDGLIAGRGDFRLWCEYVFGY
jgi:hypothetical protein